MSGSSPWLVTSFMGVVERHGRSSFLTVSRLHRFAVDTGAAGSWPPYFLISRDGVLPSRSDLAIAAAIKVARLQRVPMSSFCRDLAP